MRKLRSEGSIRVLRKEVSFCCLKGKMWFVQELGKGEPECAGFFMDTEPMKCPWEWLFWELSELMRRHIEAGLKRQNSEGSRCSNTLYIQSSPQSKLLKSELGCCIIKIDRSKPKVHTKKPCTAFRGRHPVMFFSG